MLLVGDAAAVTLAVLLALWTWSITAGFPFNVAFLRVRAVWLLAVPLWLALLGPTRPAGVAFDIRQTADGIARAAAALLVLYLGSFFYAGGDRLPRLVALYLFWDATLLVLGWRIIALWFFTRAPFSRRVLVVGSGGALSTALDVLRHSSFRDADVVGVVTDEATRTTAWDASKLSAAAIVGSPTDIDQIAQRLDVTDLIVALDGSPSDVDDNCVQRLLRCRESGTQVVRLAQLYEDTLRRVPVEHVEPSWLLTNFFDVAPFRDASPLAKRLLDVVVAAILSLGGLLLVPLVGIAILIESGPPIFYQQERLGRGGRLFRMTKFRTMRHDAEPGGRARWSMPNDARVTRVGRWLRRTRLDELPNLVAVLRGEMSMVGPRPERPQFVEQLEREVPLYRARLIVSPGLTGWAQVNWMYGSSIRDAIVKLEYDLYYIKHQSVWFDALILLRTVGTMLRLGGQ